ATTLVADGNPFNGLTLSPPPVNFRYDNPSQQGREYYVSIVAGDGYKQSRRIASNAGASLTLEYPWGVTPSPGDAFEVYAIVAMPEAINPAEGYMANWNNKAATADDGNNFGRLWRHIFILERLANENQWDRAKQRTLNADVAGLDGKGDLGRYLLPRIRQAVNGVGNGGNDAVDTVLARLEAHQAGPDFGRNFNHPVTATTAAGEVAFMNSLINALSQDIYGDELSGSVPVPSGSRALSLVQHAIDSAAGDLPGACAQAYAGDYFNGTDWRVVVRDTFARLATAGVPDDSPRPQSTYNHPLSALLPALSFDPTPQGNRGTYEQIVEVGPLLKGEFIFPLGQSGLIQGSLAGVSAIDPNFTSLHPIWRDWRFVPMLPIGRDVADGGADSDGDDVPDAFERWYYDDLSRDGSADGDGDGLSLAGEYAGGVDPTNPDSDGDGIRDAFDVDARDRLEALCGGDCNGDRSVKINELLLAVSVSLDTAALDVCAAADINRNEIVSIDELIRSVNAALLNCVP
ncbi:MAG TPA: penicillin acylase family protein, partial [Rhizomicrobium sp.]